MRKIYNKTNLLAICVVLILSGCANMRPLTLEEKTTIKNVFLQSKFPERLDYIKLGFTIFTNKSSDFDDMGLFEELEKSFKSELQKRGYTLTTTLDTSDIGLTLDIGTTDNDPYRGGVKGAGFYRSFPLALANQIEAQVLIKIRLINPNTGKQRYSTFVNKRKAIPILSNANKWSDFSEDNKKLLMFELKLLVSDIASEALDKLGLE